jgi:phosphoribosylformylglycinamidine synthase
VTLWQIEILPADGQPDLLGQSVHDQARELGIAENLNVRSARGFLLDGELSETEVQRLARELLADSIVEQTVISQVGREGSGREGSGQRAANLPVAKDARSSMVVYVLPKPGVTDPVAKSTEQALDDLGMSVDAASTFRKYWLNDASGHQRDRICNRILANDSIEDVVHGELSIEHLSIGSPYQLDVQRIAIGNMDLPELRELSVSGQLYMQDAEMQTVQKYFGDLGRDPTDIELETIAQTWSEHCSHKTLAGRIAYTDENGERQFDNMLKETIFAATMKVREEMGQDDWCVSVFADNAGVVKFDDDFHVVFKVETHNHPSAIEPYGGANTGLGGVIRDPLGTGLGAKPVCNTDVFCFAPPDTDPDSLPPGVLHPKRVMNGVVAGVRDYGNRMGIPTVNGAVFFDHRYLGNPLVYCGNVGLLPVDKVEKAPLPGDYIVSMGGRTGRDGIHGATFSSVELTEESESISGGAVQIGNAITEKMVLDVLMAARDEGLYSAVTDCGAGGFSSAVGEMGEKMGAEVWLDKAPLKYEGLSHTEIWISEAQERMVMAVPPDKWPRLKALAESEGVEVSVIGEFVPTGILRLMYAGEEVGSVSMEFLHDGRPPVIRQATFQPTPEPEVSLPTMGQPEIETALGAILGSWNVASKHWVIRQYDHEVQAGSVVKPLVGPACEGPSDAAVVAPRLGSRKGLVISNGMNPRYGDLDPYHMAASAMDEAVRNAVATGADPSRIAVLDNFCWGNTERAETLGTLVRAAIACHDLSVAWKMPFISGKDSLNNEFAWSDSKGQKQQLVIPSSLLISAMGQIDDVRNAVTMDLKKKGNLLYLVGPTRDELGGSHLLHVLDQSGGKVPQVDVPLAKRIFMAVHSAMSQKLIRSCHDLSEGGLAVALAEMAFAGELGVDIDIAEVAKDSFVSPLIALFAESNSRFLCEIPETHAAAFESCMANVPLFQLGSVTGSSNVTIRSGSTTLVDLGWSALKARWRAPLDWA